MAGDRLHRNSTNGPFPSSSKEKKKKNDLSAADLLPHVGQRRGSSKEKFCSRDLTGLSLQGASVFCVPGGRASTASEPRAEYDDCHFPVCD
ncbi:uncharacterized protein LOC119878084 isoform X2 [Canis lupus familiaris]|uniref:uncharacterized protein LOC119878084 isoform X2 n=1 Tax=Canis lupus familiaris TaxID=9615 RepID=UPI0018F5C0D5|nr:uncharacterized protein LOC119878084 isoform X2 [Canis lupus familiaris]